MAYQQDPNANPSSADPPRASSEKSIMAGGSDTYRAPGFTSQNVTPPSSSLSSITAPPSTQPQTTTWGKYSGVASPGILAAISSGGSGQPGQPNKQGPILGAIDALSFANFKPNNSPLQDIGGALYSGGPVTDADWLKAGYGPGGAALAPSAQPQTGLRSIFANPAAAAALFGPAGLVASSALQKQQQPLNTIPSNATLNTF